MSRGVESLSLFLPVKLRRGREVNLRQAENVVFFLSVVVLTAHCYTHPDTMYTHFQIQAEKHIRNPGPLPLCVGGVGVGGWGGRWGKLIFLLREIDVICSALHCLRMI